MTIINSLLDLAISMCGIRLMIITQLHIIITKKTHTWISLNILFVIMKPSLNNKKNNCSEIYYKIE